MRCHISFLRRKPEHFRYLEKKKGVPFTFLDVPYRDDAESADYLANQLKDFAKELENRFGRKLQEENLREAIKIENETRKALMEFFSSKVRDIIRESSSAIFI